MRPRRGIRADDLYALEDIGVVIPGRVLDILRDVGQVASEVFASSDDYRAFVSVSRFRPEAVPGGSERFRYFGQRSHLYSASRFQVKCEILDSDDDVSEEELAGLQRIVLPDETSLEFVLRLWLPDLDVLVEPRLTDVPV